MNDEEIIGETLCMRERLMLKSSQAKDCFRTLNRLEQKDKEKELKKLNGGVGSEARKCTTYLPWETPYDHQYRK